MDTYVTYPYLELHCHRALFRLLAICKFPMTIYYLLLRGNTDSYVERFI